MFSVYLSLAFSVIYLVLVQLIPHKMAFIAVGAGMVILLIAAIVVLTYKTDFVKTKILIGVLMLLLLVFSILTIIKHKNSLYLYAIYLKWSTKAAKDRKLTVIYILIFMLILLAFCLLIIFEFTGFWTSGDLEFNP